MPGGHLGPGSAAEKIHILNVGTVALAKGVAVKLGSAAQFAANKYLFDSIAEDALPGIVVSGAADVVLGVPQQDIPAGQVGELVKKGIGYVLSGAGIAADAKMTILTANGKFDDATGSHINSNAHYGVALEAAAGADELIQAFIDIPSVEAEA